MSASQRRVSFEGNEINGAAHRLAEVKDLSLGAFKNPAILKLV